MRSGLVRPLFIVGSGRSGTTALCAMLNCHSQIMIAPGECPMVHEVALLASGYRSGEAYYKESTALPERRMRTKLRSFCIDCVWGDSATAMLVRSTTTSEGTVNNKDWPSIQVWGAKAFPDSPASEGLQWLFPRVRFVYLFRNGIDVVFSMSRFRGFREMSFVERCLFWSLRAQRYEFLRHHDRAIAIRFEDFLNDPDTELRRILSHIQLPYEEGPIRFASNTLVHPLDQPTESANPRSVLSLRAPAHQYWSSTEKRIFRDVCSPAMDLLGYEIPFS
jgi:hypothetical protein